ncbi:MAG: hypothetical protein ACOYEP_10380, partial [Limnochordia bacterium]
LERSHADLLWRGSFVDTEYFVLDTDSECVSAKAYRIDGDLGVLLRNESEQSQDALATAKGWRLTGAFDIDGPVDPAQPLPARSVRLIRFRE